MNRTVLFVVFIVLNLTVFGQEDPVIIKRITGLITFDGIPMEHTWNDLDLFPLTMHKPVFGSQPSEKSDIRIGYDDQFLWIGAKLYMNDADKIFAATKQRDAMLFSYDAFGVVLDTYNDNENALAFYTAPTGLRSDYTISNDATANPGGSPMAILNRSWNTFWDVRTSVDNNGWYLEMRIPFSSLKFKPENNMAIMGLILIRNISSNIESDTYPGIDPKYGYMSVNKPSLAQTIVIEGAQPSKPLYVSPYIIGGFTRDYSLNDEETMYIRNDRPKFDAGLDIKYNINSNLTLDLTANTDFAQVEADDQKVNLTRYSLYLPEKRMFFQERSSLFDFSLGGVSDNLFYSRRIGIADDQLIRIYGGARLTGRLGNWDLGFLNMQTAPDEEVPGENFGVLRMRRRIINENSYVGGIITSRMGMNGHSNLAYGLDGMIRLYDDDYLNIKLSQTYDSDNGNNMYSLDPSFALIDWERRSEEGLAYKINYTYLGSEFDPGIGFLSRNGVQGLSGQILYGWLPGEESKLLKYNINLKGENYKRTEDGNLESMKISPGFEFSTKSGIHTSISLDIQSEGVQDDFFLSDSISINAGNYSFIGSHLMVTTPSSKPLSVRLMANAGQFFDGNKIGFNLRPRINISSSLNISAMYEFNAIRFPSRGENNSMDVHNINLKIMYMPNTKLTTGFLIQYVNTDDELVTNFRLRYNPREGNDLYLVFNDFRCLNRESISPRPPDYFNETILVKYVHTFIL